MPAGQRAKTVAFNFVPGTSLIAVPVTINDRNGFFFLLDTGASKTVLSVTAADRIDITKGRNSTLLTANGIVQVGVRLLESLGIADARLTDIEIDVGDFPLMRTLHVDGILGADYLRRFKLSIDYDNQVVEIEPYVTDSISALFS